jgi:hypothetical protein
MCFALSLLLGVEHQAADLQTQRKLLAIVVTRSYFHRLDLYRHRVVLDLIKKPRQ